ncbi:hypothetical protein [Pedobacter sp. WC2423]|uniref:hypothetical protein n=1 Tax=Pedobacter sp. WC2423 TaxID=3234142 RepID=UPI0034664B28
MYKKKMYSIVLIVLVVVLGLLIRAYFRSESYFLSRLPEKYKSYPALNEKIKSADYQIIPLFTGSRPRTIYRDSMTNNIIVESVEEFAPKKYEETTYSITYYRINSKGEPLDSLNETGSTAFGRPFNGHLLYEDTYSDYLKTGKHEKLPYKVINKDLAMIPEVLSSLTRELLSRADAVTVYKEDDPMTFIMSVSGEVYKVYIPKKSNINIPAEFEHNFHELLPVTDYSHQTGLKHYNWESPKSAITINYFLKQHYQSGTYFSMAAAPSTRPARWYGMGYFELKIGTDNLKFKHPISYFSSKNLPSGGYYYNGEWGTLDLFNAHMSDLNILTVGFDNNHFHELDGCYLVVRLHLKK